MVNFLILLEVLGFAVAYTIIGFLLRREDPFFFNTLLSPSILISMVLSLYYGFRGGLPFVGLLSLASVLLYEKFPIPELLWNTIVVLIASEFRYYWSRRIKTAEFERDYLQEHIDRLKKELFLLKLSHDQLEFNYIVKPYSLRRMIKELREKMLINKEDKALVEFFLSILSYNFQVYKAGVFKLVDDKVDYIAGIGGMEKNLDLESPPIKEAIESEESYYLPPKALKKVLEGEDDTESRYLAVIVASSERDRYLLVIKDMLFVNLNEEVLTYIQILMQYIVEDITFAKNIAPLYKKESRYCDYEFVKELYKMAELKRKLGVLSSIVVFSSQNLTEEDLYEIEHSVRSLDLVCYIPTKGLVIFLLPFTAPLNAKSFAKRIQDKHTNLELVLVHEVKEPSLESILTEVRNNV
ncbi:PelD-like GGDEF domain-containing protein [Hydrogenivirga caldilitoris]|uniref:PelD-like GGDEF domain-containing protein n=1 Tax=Hydrogenivirga caldilitoris TaxID=246264 RepID=A0A497XT75_9AQUI|nr:PelD GGDEF domain-containing protein [Hydrogenivirga caldilitoris]RLJ70113.1 PelD-like GGDEF domain-containing protein [Hydrogenivirga caldilitoris]